MISMKFNLPISIGMANEKVKIANLNNRNVDKNKLQATLISYQKVYVTKMMT